MEPDDGQLAAPEVMLYLLIGIDRLCCGFGLFPAYEPKPFLLYNISVPIAINTAAQENDARKTAHKNFRNRGSFMPLAIFTFWLDYAIIKTIGNTVKRFWRAKEEE